MNSADKREATLLYQSLSTQLHRGLDFAIVNEADGADGAVAVAFGVKQLPHLLVLPAAATADGNAEPLHFDGALKAAELRAWLAGHSADKAASSATSGDGDGKDDKSGGGAKDPEVTQSEAMQMILKSTAHVANMTLDQVRCF